MISFLNSCLGFEGEEEIKSLTIANPYQVPKIEELKETILDIKAINKKGEHFIVEMQKKDAHNFHKRSVYYTAKTYTDQLNKAEDFSLLQKVYFIGIINFNMFEGENYVSRHLIVNQETGKNDLDNFVFCFLELKKFNKKESELSTLLDKWMYFLRETKTLEMIPKEFETIEEFKDAFFVANQHQWDKKELEIYDYVRMKESDNRIADKIKLEKQLKKGLEQGLEKSILTLSKNMKISYEEAKKLL